MNANLRMPLMASGVLVAAAIGLYWYLSGGRYQTTDDAYVQMAQVPISANIAGRISEIAAHENQAVHRGDLLFRLEDAPYRIAANAARAQLAAARLQLTTLKADYQRRRAELVAAAAARDYTQRELVRQQRLAGPGISTQAQVDLATHLLDDATAQVSIAQQQLAAASAALDGNPALAPEKHPLVQQAQAQLDRAQLDLSYCTVTAPADGVVAHIDSLQVGGNITAATPLFALVNAGDLWIEANFKEDQLTHLRSGQAADVNVDSYPGLHFSGHVASVSPGTGSQFSVLPPENASGNWVKVVQRLPVRIRLDHVDAVYPLQGGLSAAVTVDTQYRRHLFGRDTPAASAAR
jgi:membrane fusion protein (multidrug efflux system)